MKPIALLLPLLAAPAALLSNDAPEPPEPYVVRLDGLTESSATRVESALAEVTGVSSVELDVEHSVARLATKDEALLARPMIDAALADVGVTSTSFDEPRWSQVDVYIVEAEGGG